MGHVSILILAPMMTDLRHCIPCRPLLKQAGLETELGGSGSDLAPEEVREAAQRLRLWITRLRQAYGDRVHIQLIDAYSPEGFVCSLRYWVRTYPTFIVGRREKTSGWDWPALRRAVDSHLKGTHPD
jgi:hypothetical protein